MNSGAFCLSVFDNKRSKLDSTTLEINHSVVKLPRLLTSFTIHCSKMLLPSNSLLEGVGSMPSDANVEPPPQNTRSLTLPPRDLPSSCWLVLHITMRDGTGRVAAMTDRPTAGYLVAISVAAWFSDLVSTSSVRNPGIIVTSQKRQDFRIQLQKRARRRAEKKIEYLEDDKNWKEVNIVNTFFYILIRLCIEFFYTVVST